MGREKTQMVKAQDYSAAAQEEHNEALAGVTYSLTFINNSFLNASACVYQQDPDINDPKVMSLAWFSKYAYSGSKVTFKWTIDYNFVWAHVDSLTEGVIFIASQTESADLSTTNQVSLLYDPLNDAYRFSEQTPGTPGVLTINESGSIPVQSKAAVGIGMSGEGTFVEQARPNLKLSFTPHPEYWITFGNYTQGEVLDVTQITSAAQIIFPRNVYSMTAVLNENNQWEVGQTSDFLPAFVKARGSRPLGNSNGGNGRLALSKGKSPAYQCED